MVTKSFAVRMDGFQIVRRHDDGVRLLAFRVGKQRFPVCCIRRNMGSIGKVIKVIVNDNVSIGASVAKRIDTSTSKCTFGPSNSAFGNSKLQGFKVD